MKESVCCSAPGKVLLTGGYLILERPHSGLVSTVNARFYTIVEPIHLESDDRDVMVEVYSPQFLHKEIYRIESSTKYHLFLKPLSVNHQANLYTEKSIFFSLMVIRELIPEKTFWKLLSLGLRITILGDNDFYSQRDQLLSRQLPLTANSLSQLPRFLICASSGLTSSLSQMKKTGLGSSAALVTSLVASLLVYFGAIRLPRKFDIHQNLDFRFEKEEKASLSLVNNLAQLCHCLAQGKVGSGFDVSAATYGSQRYVRFSPKVLLPVISREQEFLDDPRVSSKLLHILQSNDQDANVDGNSDSKAHNNRNVVGYHWDSIVEPFRLPPCFELLLGDVSIGSNTPDMVGKVLKWKQTDPQASRIFAELNYANCRVESLLEELYILLSVEDTKESEYNGEDMDRKLQNSQSLSLLFQSTVSNWKMLATTNTVAEKLVSLRESFQEVRHWLREMGLLAGVEIEPETQGKLLDETMAVPGVLIAGVPGAGGFDAIFAISLCKESSKLVESLWVTSGVLPLKLREDSSGVRVDSPPCFSNL